MSAKRLDSLCRRMAKPTWVAAIDPIHCQLERIAQFMCVCYRHGALTALVLIVGRRIDVRPIRKLLLLQAPHSSRELQSVAYAVWFPAAQQIVIHPGCYATHATPPLFSV